MGYLGNTPTTQSFTSGTDYFNGTGSQTAFTLTRSVNSVNDIQVTVNNVVQQPNDAYTVSGTTLTMTSAPSSGTNNVYVRYLSTTTQTIAPSSGVALSAALGTASSPSYSFIGDSNTGIFSPAADTIAFAEGGVEAMRIDSSGNVGIGASSVTGGYRAQINGNLILGTTANPLITGTTTLSLYGDNSAATGMTINTAGKVGIGTASPTGKLHVYGSGEVQTLQRSSGSANNYTLFKTESGADQAYLGFSDAGVNDFAIYNVQNGYIRFGTNNAERMRITSGGDVFIGTTTTFSYANGDLCVNANGGGDPAIVAGVNSTSAAYNNIVLGNSTGGVGRIQTNGSATAYLTSSDYRLKKDVTPIQDALGTIESLNPVAFTWNVDNRQDAGFLAHEFQEVLPNYADGTKDGVDADGKPAYQAVDKSGVIPFLVKAIQELNAKVEAQAAEIAALKGANNAN